MKIQLVNIPQGHSVMEKDVLPAEFDFGKWLQPVGPVRVRLEADRRDQQVTLRGEAMVAARDTCARCLIEYEFELESEIMILADRRGSEKAEEEDALEQEGSILYHEGLDVDLGPSIREAVILEVPQAVLCRTDCRGLCPECGTNRNETSCDCEPSQGDPRWGALTDLQDDRPEVKR